MNTQGDVEGGGYVVDTEGYSCPGPEHHHGGLETGGVVATVIYDDLRDELWIVSTSLFPLSQLWVVSFKEWGMRRKRAENQTLVLR